MIRNPDFIDECYKHKDLSLLKKLTLIIPTYNRNCYLSRCLWYHAHFPFKQIIVADSSLEEKMTVNQETVEDVREMFGTDVLYLKYRPETEKYGGDIYRKWGDAVQRVETEYSQICTDKEFLIPESLCQQITFLDKNEEYVSSSGNRFFIKQNTNRKNKHYLVPKVHHQCSEISDNPLERLEHALSEPIPFDNNLLLTLFRTSVQKQLYLSIQKYAINTLRYGELFLGYMGYIYGKTHTDTSLIHKIRDIIYLEQSIDAAQNANKTTQTSESSTSRMPPYSCHKILFYDCFKKAVTETIISNTCGISEREICEFIDKKMNPNSFNRYWPESRQLLKKSFWSYIPRTRMFIHQIKLPYKIRQEIHKLDKYGLYIPVEGDSILNLPDTDDIQVISKTIDLSKLKSPKMLLH